MSYRGALMFNAATDQLQKSAQDLEKTKEARTTLDQKQQALDNQKKLTDVKLEGARLSNKHTALENDLFQKTIDEMFSKHQDILDGQAAQIDQAEHQASTDYKKSNSIVSHLFNNDPTVHGLVMAHVNPQPTVNAPGPDGGTVQGQDMNADETPDAVGSLFGGLPQEGDTRPTVNVSGKGATIANKTVTGREVNRMQLQRIQQAQDQGIPLNDQEQAMLDKSQGMKPYNRGEVLRLARTMAMDQASAKTGIRAVGLSIEDRNAAIPQAEQSLYGKVISPVQQSTTLSNIKTGQPITGNSAPAKPDSFGYVRGDVKAFSGRAGKYEYLGNGKFKRVQ